VPPLCASREDVPEPEADSCDAVAARVRVRVVEAGLTLRPAFLNFIDSNGTWTTTKPGRREPLNQPAPPPGLARVVPKKRPLIDM
jgi:hypothetical protein